MPFIRLLLATYAYVITHYNELLTSFTDMADREDVTDTLERQTLLDQPTTVIVPPPAVDSGQREEDTPPATSPQDGDQTHLLGTRLRLSGLLRLLSSYQTMITRLPHNALTTPTTEYGQLLK